MDETDVRKNIQLELEKRQTKVLNKNAVNALFEALPSPVKALGKIFVGRQDAIENEKQKITQDIILDLLVSIDRAITQAMETAHEKGIDWKVISGNIQSYGERAKEVIGVEIFSDAGSVELKAGTHIRATGKDVDKITGLKIGGNQSNKEDQ
jgi:2-hydroxy-3-keto-5-methylthiopentenyl-1-phosphate phosphatase